MSYMVLKLLPDNIALLMCNPDAMEEGDDGGEGVFESFELASELCMTPGYWKSGGYTIVKIEATMGWIAEGETHGARYDIKESQRHATIVALQRYVQYLREQKRTPVEKWRDHNVKLQVLIDDALGAHDNFLKKKSGD